MAILLTAKKRRLERHAYDTYCSTNYYLPSSCDVKPRYPESMVINLMSLRLYETDGQRKYPHLQPTCSEVDHIAPWLIQEMEKLTASLEEAVGLESAVESFLSKAYVNSWEAIQAVDSSEICHADSCQLPQRRHLQRPTLFDGTLAILVEAPCMCEAVASTFLSEKKKQVVVAPLGPPRHRLY